MRDLRILKYRSSRAPRVAVAEGPSGARSPWIRVTPARRLAFFLTVDALAVLIAVGFAVLLRFDGPPGPELRTLYAWNGVGVAALTVAILWMSGSYRASWSFIGLRDIGRIAGAVAFATTIAIGAILALRAAEVFPTPSLGVQVIQASVAFCAVSGFRISRRALRLLARGPARPTATGLILGGGEAGAQVLKSLQESRTANPLKIIGLLDDDPLARGTAIHGVRVLGPVASLPDVLAATPVRTVIICMPAADSAFVKEVLRTCRAHGVAKVRIVPTMTELVGSDLSFAATREVTLEDLLGRAPVSIDVEGVRQAIQGRAVLVTGGAGTIGSELCRQIARMGPSKLVVLDVDETRVHDLALDLADSDPTVQVVPALVDVRDAASLDSLFRAHEIHLVFHAAAYKHVPMMERWPLAALDVNVLGTMRVYEAAAMNGAEGFVLVSTDKAVEPSSIMGASKRLAELTLFGASGQGPRVSAVRFGNVLGSRGSVVPTFERQLKRGGPITVTHPDVTRYFMMTSEAVQLVLQSAILGAGREIFVLDMGTPVRILDVASELIRLHGLEPDKDVKITFTGLRPGEKLTESLHYMDETVESTSHSRIFKTHVRVTPDRENMRRTIEGLVAAKDDDLARRFFEQHFPTLRPRATPPVRAPPLPDPTR